jgi:hypothetical protein
MITFPVRSPQSVLSHFGFEQPPACADHHFTGPLPAQQSEGQGSVFHIEGQLLYAMATDLGGPVLEIGSDLGVSTRYIHEGLEDTGAGPVVAVDYCHKFGDDLDWPLRIRIECDTHKEPGKIPALPYRWAFIDGDHRYDGVLQDIKLAVGLGINTLVFHDTRADIPVPTNPSDGSEARRAVTDYFMSKPWVVWDIPTPAGLMLAFRSNK